MAENYYTLKRQANQLLLKTLKYLQANPKKAVAVPALTIEFQRDFGFTQRTLLKMLQAYIETNQLIIIDNHVQLGTNVQKEK